LRYFILLTNICTWVSLMSGQWSLIAWTSSMLCVRIFQWAWRFGYWVLLAAYFSLFKIYLKYNWNVKEFSKECCMYIFTSKLFQEKLTLAYVKQQNLMPR
jgi:hypothetical protein